MKAGECCHCGSLLSLSSHLPERSTRQGPSEAAALCAVSIQFPGGHRRCTLLSHSWGGASGLIPQGDQTLVASWWCLGTMETKEVKGTLLSQPPTEPRGVLVLGSDRPPCSPLILISCKLCSLLHFTSCANAFGCIEQGFAGKETVLRISQQVWVTAFSLLVT